MCRSTNLGFLSILVYLFYFVIYFVLVEAYRAFLGCRRKEQKTNEWIRGTEGERKANGILEGSTCSDLVSYCYLQEKPLLLIYSLSCTRTKPPM